MVEPDVAARGGLALRVVDVIGPAVRLRAGAAGLVAVLAMLLGGCSGPSIFDPDPEAQCTSAEAPESASTETNRILGESGVSRIPISYVVLIDVSQSMAEQNRYGQVLEAMRRFLGALAPDDNLAVITFEGTPATVVPLSPRGTGEQQLAALPANPPGLKTNIGLAIDQAISELEGVPVDQPAAIVLFTDGEQDAADGSRFAGTTGDDWTTLRDRAVAATAGRSVDAYAVPLAEENEVGLLCTVFDGAQLLPVSTSVEALSSYLERAQTDARLQAAAQLMQADDGSGVTARWRIPADIDIDAREVTVELELTNTAAGLPLVVDGSRVTADGELVNIASDLPPRFELAPAQVLTIPVRLTWDEPDDSSPFVAYRGEYRSTLSVEGAVSSPLADQLRQLPLPGAAIQLAGQVSGSGDLVGTGQVGWSPVLLIVTVVLVLAGMGVAARAFPAADGELELTAPPTSGRTAPGEKDRGFRLSLPLATAPFAVYRLLTGRRLTHADSRIEITARGRRGIGLLRGGERWLSVRVRLLGDDLGGPPREARVRLPPGGTRLVLGLSVTYASRAVSPLRCP